MTKRHWPTTPKLLTAYDFVTLSWERAKTSTDPGGKAYALAYFSKPGNPPVVKLLCEKTLDLCHQSALDFETCGYTLDRIAPVNP